MPSFDHIIKDLTVKLAHDVDKKIDDYKGLAVLAGVDHRVIHSFLILMLFRMIAVEIVINSVIPEETVGKILADIIQKTRKEKDELMKKNA